MKKRNKEKQKRKRKNRKKKKKREIKKIKKTKKRNKKRKKEMKKKKRKKEKQNKLIRRFVFLLMSQLRKNKIKFLLKTKFLSWVNHSRFSLLNCQKT